MVVIIIILIAGCFQNSAEFAKIEITHCLCPEYKMPSSVLSAFFGKMPNVDLVISFIPTSKYVFLLKVYL